MNDPIQTNPRMKNPLKGKTTCYTGPMESKQTFGCLSFALYWAWVFTVVINAALLPDMNQQTNQIVRMAGSAGIAIGLAAQYVALPRLSLVDSRVYAALVAALPFAHGMLLVAVGIGAIEPPAWTLAMLTLLSAMSSSLLLASIGAGFSSYAPRHRIAATCLASTTGALISVAISMLSTIAASACVSLLIPLSVALFRKADLIPAAETARHSRAAIKELRHYRALLMFMFLFSTIFGLMLADGSMLGTGNAANTVALISICAPGIIVLFIIEGSLMRVDVESLQRMLLACAIICLGALALSDEAGGVIFAAALVVCFGVFDMASFASLYEIIRENNLPSLSTFALARIPAELGIALGWVLGAALRAAFPGTGNVTLLASFVVATAILIGLALVRVDGKRGKTEQDDTESKPKEPALGGIWEIPGARKRAVCELERRFALSPREREVFEMLAEGRSPKRISEKMFLSESTVKSHCYRIYRKANVHSQQDLLDLVDAEEKKDAAQRFKIIP